MEDNRYICPSCGSKINPGDQVCISCGNKIPNVTLSLTDLEHKNEVVDTKEPINKTLLLSILFAVVFILVVFLFVWFFVLKRS